MVFDFFPSGSFLMNYIDKCLRDIVPEFTDAFMQKLTMQIFIIGSAAGLIFFLMYPMRKVEKRLEVTKQKIKDIKECYKALVVRDAILCNLNFGVDKKVPIGALNSNVDVEQLKKSVKKLEEAIAQKMELTGELAEHIEPFLDEVKEDAALMKKIEDGDTMELLELFGLYLEDIEPVLGKRISEGESQYNIILEENKALKEENLELDKLIKEMNENNTEIALLQETLT